ncbi:MAG: hypothetical protein KatS3mg131_0125 [Candidatus Tectimicrobiota bacterium]|nr:MAG: hypothetical protein KatS3mg131_0125 [Candidatus Tectomicrobia bacterium]
MVKVLIVDDEPYILRALTLLLQKEGYEVSVAHNGTEGLAKLEAERPEVAIVDVMMPGMDGLELLQRWHAQGAEAARTRFFLLTASCEERITAYVARCDNVHLIAKPFSPSAVVRLVRDATRPRTAVRPASPA